jgi:iron complex transport system permease protein
MIRVAATQRPARVRPRGGSGVLATLGVLLACAMVLALGTGAMFLSPADVLGLVGERLGLWRSDLSAAERAVFEAIRAPRVLLAAAAGAALGAAGAAVQGVFRNPLADPGLIGVSAGAALGAVTIIVLGPTLFRGTDPAWQAWLLPLAAFAGGLVATCIVYAAAQAEGRVIVSTMLLAGVAVGAIAGAGLGWLTFLSDEEQLRTLTFWMLGSVGGATWGVAVPTILLIAAALAPILALHRSLNILALGEQEARHLGCEPTRTVALTAALAAVAVGAAVAACGIIGFVGLIAPHLVRLAAGPDHRLVLPGSALLGAALLVVADTIARTVVAPAELPLGVVTALVGGPFFFWLLIKDKRRVLG